MAFYEVIGLTVPTNIDSEHTEELVAESCTVCHEIRLVHSSDSRTVISIPDIFALRHLALWDFGTTVTTDLEIVILSSKSIYGDYRGSFSTQQKYTYFKIGSTESPTGTRIMIGAAYPLDVSGIASDLVALFFPGVRSSKPGSPRIALAPNTPHSSLAYLETALPLTVRNEREPTLMRANDLVVCAPSDLKLDDLDPNIESYFKVSPDQIDSALNNFKWNSLDLRIHNPIGRKTTKKDLESLKTLKVSIEGETLSFQSVDSKRALTIELNQPSTRRTIDFLLGYHYLDLSSIESSQVSTQFIQRLTEAMSCGMLAINPFGLSNQLLQQFRQEFPVSFVDRPAAAGINFDAASVSSRRTILSNLGGNFQVDRYLSGKYSESTLPSVSFLLVTMRPDRVRSVLRQLEIQTFKTFETIIAIHGDAPKDILEIANEFPHLQVTVACFDDQVIFGEVLTKATMIASGDHVLKIDDDDIYGPNFLLDLVLALYYSGASFVGKQPEFTYITQFDQTVRRLGYGSERYSEAVAGGTMLIPKGILLSCGGWRATPRHVDRALFQRIIEHGGIGYSSNALGFTYVRHALGHTWNQPETEFLKKSSEQWHSIPKEILGLANR